jgi:hypothetical protein
MCQVLRVLFETPFLKEMHSLVAENFLLCFFLPYFTGTVWKFKCDWDGDKEMYNAPAYYMHSVIRNCCFQAWNRHLPKVSATVWNFKVTKKIYVQPWTAKGERCSLKNNIHLKFTLFLNRFCIVLYITYTTLSWQLNGHGKSFYTEINSDEE